MQMHTGRFLLPFDDELDIARQLAFRGKNRINGIKTGRYMALVVTYAAAIELAFPQAGFKRRCFPQLEWFGRLYIIVIVKQQGLISFSFSLSEDNGRTISIHDFGSEAAGTKHLTYKAGTFLEANALGADTGLCH